MVAREPIHSRLSLLAGNPNTFKRCNNTLLSKGNSRTCHLQHLCLLKVAAGHLRSSAHKLPQINSDCSIICHLQQQSLLKVAVGRLRRLLLKSSSSISSNSSNIFSYSNKTQDQDVDKGVEGKDIRVKAFKYYIYGRSHVFERAQ
jgi:hypothetical protein